MFVVARLQEISQLRRSDISEGRVTRVPKLSPSARTKFQAANLKPEFRNPKSERNPKPEARNLVMNSSTVGAASL